MKPLKYIVMLVKLFEKNEISSSVSSAEEAEEMIIENLFCENYDDFFESFKFVFVNKKHELVPINLEKIKDFGRFKKCKVCKIMVIGKSRGLLIAEDYDDFLGWWDK